jgi:hypothetical protein
VIKLYQSLHEEFFIPEPEEVFALGYPLEGGWGSDVKQLTRGVASACPTLELALGAEGLHEQVEGFAVWDLAHPTRAPISRRFARYLQETGAGALSDLARYEAAINDPEPPDPWAACLAWHDAEGALVRRAQGVEVLSLSVDIGELTEALQGEDEEREISERPHHLLIVHKAGGTRELSEVSAEAARALSMLNDGPREGHLLGLQPSEYEALKEIGAITPCAWALERTIDATEEGSLETQPTERALEVHDDPLPDAVWLEASEPLRAPPPQKAHSLEPLSAPHSASYADSTHAEEPPLASPRREALSFDPSRPPLNAFEEALRSAIAREGSPEPATPPLDLEAYEDLFVFKDLDQTDGEGPDDPDQ